VVHSWTISTPLITQTLTDSYVPDVLSPVFQLSTALSGNKTLIGGDYLLSIGGLLTDADGDAFAWTDGQADGSLPATQAYATVGDIPTEWGRWSPANDGTSGAFILNGVVPAPGAFALLGLAAAAWRRRRS
jgi:MYXO-CTERM domain-containing protein